MAKTLYIRNVPDDVAARLTAMAQVEGMSLSAFAARALTEAAERTDNAALLNSLPSHNVTPEEIVRALHEARSGL